MIRALFRVKVKNSAFTFRRLCFIFQHLPIDKSCCNDGTHIESLLGFRLACRDTKVAQRTDDGFACLQYNRRKRKLVCNVNERCFPNVFIICRVHPRPPIFRPANSSARSASTIILRPTCVMAR